MRADGSEPSGRRDRSPPTGPTILAPARARSDLRRGTEVGQDALRRTGACGRRTPGARAGSAAARTAPARAAGTIGLSSCSTFTGSVSVVSPRRQRQPPDVGVDGQPGQVQRHAAHHVGRLAPHPGHGDEVLHGRRDLAVKRSTRAWAMPIRLPGLVLVEAGGADQLLDLVGPGDGQVLGRRVPGEQRRGHHVHPGVGALRRQDGRGQQLVGVAVVELAAGVGVLARPGARGSPGPGPWVCGVGASGASTTRRDRLAAAARTGPGSLRLADSLRRRARPRRRDSDGATGRWSRPTRPTDADDAAAATDAGLVLVREVLQLRRPLPADPPPAARGAPVPAGSRRRRLPGGQQPGLRLAPRPGRLDRRRPAPQRSRAVVRPRRASCSTSATGASPASAGPRSTRPPTTSPPWARSTSSPSTRTSHGLGLGRALTLAGLDHLAGRASRVGMLYVEADNDAARALYDELGFTVHERPPVVGHRGHTSPRSLTG